MSELKLDERLVGDTHHLGQLGNCTLLLHGNALFPWFILVPDTEETELYKLPEQQQTEILQHINALSAFIEDNFTVDKLNIATIGNIVSQMHIHIVGRNKNDIAWPGVVWGVKEFNAYTSNDLFNIQSKLKKILELSS